MSKNLKYHRLVRFQSMCICKYMMGILCGILVRYSAISVNDAQRKYIWTWALFLPWLSYVWMLCVGVLPNILIGFAGWTSWLCVRYICRIGSHTDCLYSISNLFEFHLLHSTTQYVHSYMFTFANLAMWWNYFSRHSSPAIELAFCRERKLFQISRSSICESTNLLLPIYCSARRQSAAAVSMGRAVFTEQHFYSFFAISKFHCKYFEVLRFADYSTSFFPLSLSPRNRNFSANIFPSKCSMYLSCFLHQCLHKNSE